MFNLGEKEEFSCNCCYVSTLIATFRPFHSASSDRGTRPFTQVCPVDHQRTGLLSLSPPGAARLAPSLPPPCPGAHLVCVTTEGGVEREGDAVQPPTRLLA